MPVPDIDRVAVRRAMYQSEPARPASSTQFRPFDTSTDHRRRIITIGAIRYEVPSLEYVTGLERQLAAAKQTIEEQQRALRRVEASLQQVNHFLRRQGRDLMDVSGALANKIDRRD